MNDRIGSLISYFAAREPERYFLEGYVQLCELLAWAIWPRDKVQPLRFRRFAAARLIRATEDGALQLPGSLDKASLIDQIFEIELGKVTAAREIVELCEISSFWIRAINAYRDAVYGLYILEFFLGYQKSLNDRHDQPSLKKAYHLISQGGHGDKSVQVSTLKSRWSKYCMSLPLLCAFEHSSGLDEGLLFPHNKFGPYNYLLHRQDRSSFPIEILQIAAGVQQKFVDLLDRQAKKKRWWKYPPNLVPIPIEFPPLTREMLDISNRYRAVVAKGVKAKLPSSKLR